MTWQLRKPIFLGEKPIFSTQLRHGAELPAIRHSARDLEAVDLRISGRCAESEKLR
jgi:hypothetical protein